MKVPGTKKIRGFYVTEGEWIPLLHRAKHSDPIPEWNRAAKRALRKHLKKEVQKD